MASLIFALSVFGFILILFAKQSFRSKYTVIVQFVAGLLIIELAWFHTLINIVFIIMAIGDANNWGINTVLGFALCAYNASQLWIIHNRSLDVKSSMKTSLAGAYNDDYCQHIHPDRLHLINKGISKHLWLKPFRLKNKHMETISDISYGDHASNNLTIYRPETLPDTPMPVMLQIHGGGWIMSYSEYQALPLRNKLVSANWIFVSINYRLSPDAKFPDHLVDCKRALVWIKENIARYGGDPDFIMATGGSAGAHLASLLSLTGNKEINLLQPGFEETNTALVKACIPMYGVYDFTDTHNHRKKVATQSFLESSVMPTRLDEDPELWKLASPIHQLHANRPPFLIMHGELDTLAFVEEARSFAQEARTTSENICIYIEIPLTQHAFDLFYSPHCLESLKVMHIFAEINYSNYLKENA